MSNEDIKAIATTIKSLTMDAIQKANSGHPGLPMGVAEAGALIFSQILKHYPADPAWINRDRFVLSAGHGSMLLYSLLYLAGYGLTLEDLKNFRQLGSKTPGHPEYGVTSGVETTTGPLGQGFANAVGMAIAEAHLSSLFNTAEHALIDHSVYVLAGDGDLMEGVVAEAASLAGHLGLGKLFVFYDSNKITIDGSTDIAFTEDVLARFAGYGWQTYSVSAYDTDRITRFVEEGRKIPDKPKFIRLDSIIARDAPKLKGTSKAHGAPLGEEEVKATKKALGLPEDSQFYVDPAAQECFRKRNTELKSAYGEWQVLYKKWAAKNPGLELKLKSYFSGKISIDFPLPEYKAGEKIATRIASFKIMNAIAERVPQLVGGSADLSSSNKTELEGKGSFQKTTPAGRNICFGIREHAMGAISNGISLHGGLKPFCATFLIFSDYLRPAIRLSALMKRPVIYVFTHDSVFVGEDGPTHQPIEQLASLRAVPGLLVLRPGDAQETAEAWAMALESNDRPIALCLTRQNLVVYEKSTAAWKKDIRNGAYVAKDSGGPVQVTVIATGSEVNLAIQVFEGLARPGIRVVSMLSRELFLNAPKDFQERIVPAGSRRLVIEAGVSQGWDSLAGPAGKIMGIDRFGESGPGELVYGHLGFTVERVMEEINALLR